MSHHPSFQIKNDLFPRGGSRMRKTHYLLPLFYLGSLPILMNLHGFLEWIFVGENSSSAER